MSFTDTPPTTDMTPYTAVVTVRQFNDFNAASRQRIGWPQSSRRFAMLATLAIAVVFVAIVDLTDRLVGVVDIGGAMFPSTMALIACGVGMLTAVIIIALQARIYSKQYLNAALREGGHYLGQRVFQSTEAGLKTSGDHGEALTRWSTFIDATVFGETLILWTDPAAGVMIPVAAFSSAVEMESFRQDALARMAAARGSGVVAAVAGSVSSG